MDCQSKPRAWLLSAYRADSHAAWADWLIREQNQYDWLRFELAGRHFRWRIRGNPLSWIDVLPEAVPELIVATSMVDLATLKGLPCITSTRTSSPIHSAITKADR